MNGSGEPTEGAENVEPPVKDELTPPVEGVDDDHSYEDEDENEEGDEDSGGVDELFTDAGAGENLDDLDPTESSDSETVTMSDDEYREKYTELLGKKPHHNTKIETIRESVDDILYPKH